MFEVGFNHFFRGRSGDFWGDHIWAAADQRTRGFLLGATAGRTILSGAGLQHQDGSSHLQSAALSDCRAYDPTFAYELAAARFLQHVSQILSDFRLVSVW